VNQPPKSVVREIRTPRSVGTGGGRPLPVTRWRLGWLLRDDFLLYGTGGFAYGDVAAIARNLTLKAEWLYVDLGKQTYVMSDSGVTALLGFPALLSASSDSKTHIVRTGVNYRFAWPAEPQQLVAKY